MDRIRIRGIEWGTFEKPHLRYPLIEGSPREPPWAQATRILNNTMLRQRPVIDAGQCGEAGSVQTLSREVHFRGSRERPQN